MHNIKKNSKIYWYIMILLSIFILLLVTRTQVTETQVKLDDIMINENLESDARDKLSRLNNIEKKLNSENELWIEPYMNEVSEDKIIDYIYSKVEEDNSKYEDWLSVIRNISISKWDINEVWFTEATVNINMRVPNEERMLQMLDFFTNKDSKYKFFLTSFNYPNISNWSSFNITIPLKIFYK